MVRSQPRSAAAAGTAPPARAMASPRAAPRSRARRRAAASSARPCAISHSLCSRSVTASQNDSPSSRNVAAADFRRCSTSWCSPRGRAPISIGPVEVSSFLSHLPVLLFIAQPSPCSVGPCGRATRSFRSLRAACGAACGLQLRAQQERAKPRSSRSQFARSPRFSSPQMSGAVAAAAPDTPFLTCIPTCSASLRSQESQDPLAHRA